jgi:hypothetical protein
LIAQRDTNYAIRLRSGLINPFSAYRLQGNVTIARVLSKPIDGSDAFLLAPQYSAYSAVGFETTTPNIRQCSIIA